jgi:hypothetical protein
MTQADAIRLVAAALTQFPPLTQGQRDKLEEIAAARFSDEDWSNGGDIHQFFIHRALRLSEIHTHKGVEYRTMRLSKDEVRELKSHFSQALWNEAFRAALQCQQIMGDNTATGAIAMYDNVLIFQEKA